MVSGELPDAWDDGPHSPREPKQAHSAFRSAELKLPQLRLPQLKFAPVGVGIGTGKGMGMETPRLATSILPLPDPSAPMCSISVRSECSSAVTGEGRGREE